MGDRSQTKVYFHWKNTLIGVITQFSNQVLSDLEIIPKPVLEFPWWLRQ